jgi:hypothetical protein
MVRKCQGLARGLGRSTHVEQAQARVRRYRIGVMLIWEQLVQIIRNRSILMLLSTYIIGVVFSAIPKARSLFLRDGQMQRPLKAAKSWTLLGPGLTN